MISRKTRVYNKEEPKRDIYESIQEGEKSKFGAQGSKERVEWEGE